MIYPLKFQHDSKQKIVVYSDVHYNHNPSWEIPLWKTRGFNSVFEHDAYQREVLLKKSDDNTILFLLGDTVVGAGKESTNVFENLLKLIPYKEAYILGGNHYAGYRQIFDKNFDYGIDKHYRLTFRAKSKEGNHNFGLVHFIPNYYEIFVNGQPIILSHYPMKCWNGHAHGSWVLCGHTHGSYHDSLATTLDKGKILDCSIESIKEPLDFYEIKAIMDKKKILNESHHTKDTSSPFC
jgi:calcineurin-like phosphoesterase family protein